MQFQTHARRARESIYAAWTNLGLPAGALPLAIATLVLVAVPIARAADTSTTTTTGGSPVANEAAAQPRVEAKLMRSRSIGGRAIAVRGTLKGTGGGKAHVRLWVRAAGSRKWRIVASTDARSGRHFTIKWRGERPGRYMTRVSVRKFNQSDVDRTGRAWIFRKSFASYYGPGLYGGGLACGGRLSPSTIGVAHKTLPCGTRVTFTLGNGRVVTAPVIDRGPYVAGRDWDLTAGLKRKLGFGSTGTVYTTR